MGLISSLTFSLVSINFVKVGYIFSFKYKYSCKLPTLSNKVAFYTRAKETCRVHPTKATQEMSLKIICYSWIELKHTKAINIEKLNKKLDYNIGLRRLT